VENGNGASNFDGSGPTNSMILFIHARRLSYVGGALSHVEFGRCVGLSRDGG